MTDDVISRLRDAAYEVPSTRLDAAAVTAAARSALRRRRRRQGAAVGTVLTAVVLTLTSPVHVPGVGTLTMPAARQARDLVGLGTDRPVPPPGIDLRELLARWGLRAPGPDLQAREVHELQTRVLPVVAALRTTWFQVGVGCDAISYSRGTFSQDGACAGRAGERRFDDVARADLARVVDALARSDVPTRTLRDAQYAPDGTLTHAVLPRAGGGVRWNFGYVYSPDGQPPEQQTALGRTVVTPVGDTGWWLEQEPND